MSIGNWLRGKHAPAMRAFESASPTTAAIATRSAAPAHAPITAASRGLLVCHACALVSRSPARIGDNESVECPRCSADMHLRKPDSIRLTWALLVAAGILYIPANVLPIMDTSSLFNAQRDTIMSGVIYLWSTGSFGTALIVFIASVVVPLAKLLALAFLTVSVQRKSAWRPLLRTKIYRVVTFVGRWSMLDIFVVTVLVALVQLQTIAVITAGPGALAFGVVVVLTMLAAYTFDPRLIWDPMAAEKADG
jgi:paraquat-inducible protein A